MYDLNDYSDISDDLSTEEKEFIMVAVATQIDRLSLKRLSLISKQPTRQAKINYIENELYRRSMEENISTEDLVKIHEALVWSDVEQTRTSIRDENTLSAWFNRFVFTSASIVALTVISSYLGAKICGDNHSYFCQSMHSIPDTIEAIFHEPSNKILPVNLNDK